MNKICNNCKKEKSVKLFYKNKLTKDGYASWCKECNKEYGKIYRRKNYKKFLEYNAQYRKNNKEKLKERRKIYLKENKDKVNISKIQYYYKISLEEAKILYKKKQRLICDICNKKVKDFYFIKIDHDHKTGKIRGILCGNCNSGLGQFKDNIKILNKAIKYLKKFK